MNKIIAYYLPQYHPTPDNDQWWGKGFTEWTNVAKAKRLYPRHYQPHIPADLGFYDLRMPEVREAQAQLAREAGISGFCYYHYWFGDGKTELGDIFDEVVKTGSPDFPFCLCWANESWYSKMWNKDGSVGKRLLVAQQYKGKKDNEDHFYALLSAFKDKRYITIDDKPIFVIYKPLFFDKVSSFIEQWNLLAKENGLKGVYFIGYTLDADREYNQIINLGFDAVNSCRLNGVVNRHSNTRWIIRSINKAIRVITRIPNIYQYKFASKYFITDMEKTHNVFPTIIPNWDHTPRSGSNGYLFANSTPSYFAKHVRSALYVMKNKTKDEQICFLKSWNEWGEGNYMEPDLKFGKQYINVMGKLIQLFNSEHN